MAKEQGKMLGPKALEQVGRLVENDRRQPKNRPAPGRRAPVSAGLMTYLAKTTQGFAARDEDTPSSGTVDLYRQRDGELEQTEAQQTAWNLGYTIDEGEWVIVVQDAWGSLWIVAVFRMGDCVDRIEGKKITEIDTATPSEISHALAVTSEGCIRRVGKSGCET